MEAHEHEPFKETTQRLFTIASISEKSLGAIKPHSGQTVKRLLVGLGCLLFQPQNKLFQKGKSTTNQSPQKHPYMKSH